MNIFFQALGENDQRQSQSEEEENEPILGCVRSIKRLHQTIFSDGLLLLQIDIYSWY